MGPMLTHFSGERRPRLVWLAAAPLLLAVLLLELFGPALGPLGSGELTRLGKALVKGDYLAGEIRFLAVVTAHICACIVVILMALDLLSRTPQSHPFRTTGIWLAATVGVAIPLIMLVSPANAGVVSYRAFATFFEQARVAAPFAEPLFGNGPTPLALAVTLPTIFGVVAVALTSAAAHAQLHHLQQLLDTGQVEEGEGQRPSERICSVHERMKRCLFALAVVLVTSTVSASLFFHLPTQVPLAHGFDAKSAEAALAMRFAGFAAELSLFWGLVFSLTLAAAVGLPMFLLQARVRQALEQPPLSKVPKEERELLVSSGILAEGREQVKFFTTLLAPLVAGPVSNLVQTATLF